MFGIYAMLLFSGVTVTLLIDVLDGCVYSICAMPLFSSMTVMCLYFYVI